jgi:hypothetical protein
MDVAVTRVSGVMGSHATNSAAENRTAVFYLPRPDSNAVLRYI